MPYTAKDAYRHTHKATTPKRRRAWRKVANKVLANRKKYGARTEEAAVRIANYVVNRLATGGRKMAAHRKAKPGRKAGFKHSAATKRKMSASHKARRRRKTTQRRKYARRDKATMQRVRHTMKGLKAERTRHRKAVAKRRNPGPGRPRKSHIKRLMRRKRG